MKTPVKCFFVLLVMASLFGCGKSSDVSDVSDVSEALEPNKPIISNFTAFVDYGTNPDYAVLQIRDLSVYVKNSLNEHSIDNGKEYVIYVTSTIIDDFEWHIYRYTQGTEGPVLQRGGLPLRINHGYVEEPLTFDLTIRIRDYARDLYSEPISLGTFKADPKEAPHLYNIDL